MTSPVRPTREVAVPDGRGAAYECHCGGLLAEDRRGPYCLDCGWRPQSKHTWTQYVDGMSLAERREYAEAAQASDVSLP